MSASSISEIRPAALTCRCAGLRDSSDQSRSVLANMVGNSASDIAGLGGVAGTAGMALGQLGEYAAEGNIKLGALAKVAGPMAVLGVGVLVVSNYMKGIAESKAFVKERVDGFVEALDDAVVSAGELQDILNADEISGVFAEIGNKFVNVERSIAATTGTFAEFQKVVQGGTDGFNEWVSTQLRAAQAAGASEGEIANLSTALQRATESTNYNLDASEAIKNGYGDVWMTAQALTQAISAQGTAMDQVGFRTQFYGEKTEEATKANQEATKATEDYNDSVDDSIDALREHAEAQMAAVEAMRSAADSTIAADEAQEDFIDAVNESNRLVGDAEATADDHAEAVDAQRDAMRGAADAAVRLAEDQATANGRTLTAKERIDAFNTSLLSNAQYATPAARSAIADYIIKANDVPASKATDIRAAIAAGDFETAKRLLDEASSARTAAIKADAVNVQATELELQKLARDRTARINIQTTGGSAVRGVNFGVGGRPVRSRRQQHGVVAR